MDLAATKNPYSLSRGQYYRRRKELEEPWSLGTGYALDDRGWFKPFFRNQRFSQPPAATGWLILKPAGRKTA